MADIRLRAHGHSYGNPAQLKFGFKKIEGKVLPHKGERLIMRAIKDFRADTKNEKIKWHPMMIKRIIDLMSSGKEYVFI